MEDNYFEEEEEEITNVFGLEVGDILLAEDISAWSAKGMNYYASQFAKNWEACDTPFGGNREIGGFEQLNGEWAFAVSGTNGVYLRAEGFKRFCANRHNQEEKPIIKTSYRKFLESFDHGDIVVISDGEHNVAGDTGKIGTFVSCVMKDVPNTSDLTFEVNSYYEDKDHKLNVWFNCIRHATQAEVDRYLNGFHYISGYGPAKSVNPNEIDQVYDDDGNLIEDEPFVYEELDYSRENETTREDIVIEQIAMISVPER